MPRTEHLSQRKRSQLV